MAPCQAGAETASRGLDHGRTMERDVKIDDLLFRAQAQALQAALERGDPPPEPEPITFSTVQALIQRGDLSPAEAELLDYLVAQVEQPRAELGDEDAGLISSEAVVLIKAEAARRRASRAGEGVPESELRSYAPGPPTPEKEDGPTLPVHGALLEQALPDSKDD